MNALLIHNDNLPTTLINGFNNHLKFDIGQAKILEFDFSFDREVYNQLNPVFKSKNFNVIFIPYSLSLNNYLELSGLRLALHIRLTQMWNHRYIPIVFIGHETKEQIAKLTDYGGFLFSSGTFSTTKFEYGQLKEQYEWIKNNWKAGLKPILSVKEYYSFLSRVKITPSASHQSHHGLVNEWAIYRWAKALGNLGEDNEELELIDKNVSTDLYFKYLIAINKIADISPGDVQEIKLKNKGKVLLIDDEANRGWYEIFCNLLYDKSKGMIEFEYVDDYLFRHKSQEEIIGICKNYIRKIEGLPDVVILDLRIHPSDFSNGSIKEMTGFLLLNEIKDINPGIQVIIFSASNKVWNLQALLKAGADDFILKEDVVNSVSKDFTNETISNFIYSINKLLGRKFLKNLFIKCDFILNKLKLEYIQDEHHYSLFIKDIISHTQLLKNSAVSIDLEEPMTVDIFFLNCYNFLEKFKNYYLKEIGYQIVLGEDEIQMNRYEYQSRGSNNGIVLNKGKFIRNSKYDNPSWFNCLVGLLIDYFEVIKSDDKVVFNLNKMKDSRNDYIHNNKNSFTKKELLDALNLCVIATSSIRE